MIGVDTNVLLRAFLADDRAQAKAARALLEREAATAGPLFVNLIVLCELIWVLARRQRYSRQQIIVTIESLLATAAVQLDRRQLVEEALELFRASRADFADCLILALNLGAGCSTTYTFDSDAAELRGFSPVPALPEVLSDLPAPQAAGALGYEASRNQRRAPDGREEAQDLQRG